MADSTPWDGIRKPDADYNVRRVAATQGVSLYWGRDTAGHCLFIVELGSDFSQAFRTANIAVRGIQVDLRVLDVSKLQSLVLTLEQEVDRDIFQAMCSTLVDALSPINEPSTAFAVALTHLKRWKAFMAGRKRRILSPSEQLGLFGELLFLKTLYVDHVDFGDALEAWVGPDGGHQDFIISDKAFEIKSISGKTRNTVSISSEDQLETVCPRLFMILNRIAEADDNDMAISLNELVTQMEHEISDPDVLELFGNRLIAYGYLPLSEYDIPRRRITGSKAYEVKDDFPRIVRSGIPEGIVRVRYEVELETIGAFECSMESVLEF